jgi:hypothetical protein
MTTIEEKSIKTEESAPVPDDKPAVVAGKRQQVAIDQQRVNLLVKNLLPFTTLPLLVAEEKVAIEIDEKPAIETEEPVAETEKPAIETEKPSVETEKSVVETEKPAVETEAPVVETEKPAVETDKPAVETEEPVFETEMHAVETDDKPVVKTVEKPTVVSEQPVAGSAPKRQAAEAADDESPDKKTKTAEVETEMKTDTDVVPHIIAA